MRFALMKRRRSLSFIIKSEILVSSIEGDYIKLPKDIKK